MPRPRRVISACSSRRSGGSPGATRATRSSVVLVPMSMVQTFIRGAELAPRASRGKAAAAPGALGRGPGPSPRPQGVLLGVGLELLAAGVRAEVVGLPFVLRRRLGLRLLDVHPAHRICGHARETKVRSLGGKQMHYGNSLENAVRPSLVLEKGGTAELARAGLTLLAGRRTPGGGLGAAAPDLDLVVGLRVLDVEAAPVRDVSHQASVGRPGRVEVRPVPLGE